LRFLGIILRGIRIEVSGYNVYITNQFQPTFAQGGRGMRVKSVSERWLWIARRKTLKTFVSITSKNSASLLVFQNSDISCHIILHYKPQTFEKCSSIERNVICSLFSFFIFPSKIHWIIYMLDKGFLLIEEVRLIFPLFWSSLIPIAVFEFRFSL
jgi:hypothetical protein